MSGLRFAVAHILVFFCATSCSKTRESPIPARRSTPLLPATHYDYESENWPKHFYIESEYLEMQHPLVLDDNTPANNPIRDASATLGRVLFYDTRLSDNQTIACASCHKAAMGFGDDRRLSVGFGGGTTGRHSMGLTNARFYGEARFFWDQRAATLEEQVLMPFQDLVEMGMTLESLVAAIAETSYYPQLFEAAFGDSEVTAERTAKALAQFVRSMVSTTSRYDRGRAMVSRRSDWFPNFSDEENVGKELFVTPVEEGGAGCFFCHKGEGFVAVQATTNGLESDSHKDPGFGVVSGFPRDLGTFKVPSLRNVALRPPYMHDGRFETLAEVMEHYSEDVRAHPNLSIPFQVHDGHVRQRNLSRAQKLSVIRFLETLSDPEMLSAPRFSDPFAL